MEKKNYLVYLNGIRRNFSETASIRYRQPNLKDKKYLLIVLGRCNFKCKYCFLGGEKNSQGIMPNAKLTPIKKIENEVLFALKSNLPVRISGGEPTLFMNEIIHLLKIVKKHGGFSIVDTNGSNPNVLKELSEYCNVLSIDGPKDHYEVISQTTGVGLDKCWHNPIEAIKVAEHCNCIVEFKTVIFEHTKIDYLKFLGKNLPSNSYWTLKQYQPEIGHFPEDQNQEISREINPNFKQMRSSDIFKIIDTLLKSYPHLRNRITIVIGSSRYRKHLYQLSEIELVPVLQ